MVIFVRASEAHRKTFQDACWDKEAYETGVDPRGGTIDHPPYSSDMVPRDFSLLLKLKENPLGLQFRICCCPETGSLRHTTQPVSNSFEHVYQEWVARYKKGVSHNKKYFEMAF